MRGIAGANGTLMNTEPILSISEFEVSKSNPEFGVTAAIPTANATPTTIDNSI